LLVKARIEALSASEAHPHSYQLRRRCHGWSN